jgi:CubicO group peptidase (beta-lactamase class C family)
LTPARPAKAAACIGALVEEIWSADPPSPGIAVAAVTADDMLLLHAAGAANPMRPADADTPFYLASQTKSYVGLLAAILDGDRRFPISTTLADVWPGLVLPGPVPASAISMRHLLTHRLPLRNDEMVDRASWEAKVPAADYPHILATSTPRPFAYEYDNLGYSTWAAALETATGSGWAAWLDKLLLEPMGLTRTSARTSHFAPEDMAWRYRREGEAWVPKPPKPDALMHAAGGLMSSARDVAAWLQASLRREAPGIVPAVFERAHSPYVAARAVEGPFRWSSYALGWQIGHVGGVPVLSHRGGYEGARSIASFSPALGAGFAVTVNADFKTRDLLTRLTAAFFALLEGDVPSDGDVQAAAGARRAPGFHIKAT